MATTAAPHACVDSTARASPWQLPHAPTPYFLFRSDVLARQARAFEDAFPGAAIHYAVKSNGEPEVLQQLAGIGVQFELASVHELRMVARWGVAPSRIVYGTAVKPADHIAAMADYGVSLFAFDSEAELEKLAGAAPGAGVYARVAVDETGSVFSMSEKFGADVDDVVALAQAAEARGLRFEGLSFNVGSQCHRAEAWAAGIDQIRPAVERLAAHGLDVRLLNIGGGFPAEYPSSPDVPALKEIAGLVHRALGRLACRPRLMLEPGRGLVADAGSLVTSVVGRASRRGREWLYLDAGVYNALFEALACQGTTRYAVSPVDASSAPPQAFVLAGPTGDGLDVVSEDARLPADIRVGDRLVVHRTGAYTTALASSFNGFPKPAVYVV